VYRARDLALQRDVAIKTLPRLSADMAARLRHEARTAANLLHPNLATIFAVETWRGVPMLILEYLDDGTLADRLSRGLPPIDAVARCGVAIADALGHVHARTILHRDVKPSNIGFSRGAGAKLLDFGLARLLEDHDVQMELLRLDGPEQEASAQRLTVTSGVVGTPAYLSPEAVLGEPSHEDFDLWSLSVTLYEAVTGRNPFIAHTIAATMNAILRTAVPDPREFRGDCPPALSRFLVVSLGRERERRPRSAFEFGARLREAV
jgi:eukaryotic-like serine/threonine-protein kinase